MKKNQDVVRSSEITSESVFLNRRKFIQLGIGLGAAGLMSPVLSADNRLSHRKPDEYQSNEALTPLRSIAEYNNFYEFSTNKEEPAKLAQALKISPWTITVDGEVHKAKVFDIEQLMKLAPLEERIYRFRCVEGWSMVVPWIGFSLHELIKQVEPSGSAKYVEFISLHDDAQMPGQRSNILEWPYREALRIDEAMHPLTLLTFGLYGQILPKQNGAPLRVVVPWKYGFKSAKSIVGIRFTEQRPITTWMRAAPAEYGFYANVNPAVDHQRWSQKKERRLGEYLKRPTQLFNGYAGQVGTLYGEMDLVKNF